MQPKCQKNSEKQTSFSSDKNIVTVLKQCFISIFGENLLMADFLSMISREQQLAYVYLEGCNHKSIHNIVNYDDITVISRKKHSVSVTGTELLLTFFPIVSSQLSLGDYSKEKEFYFADPFFILNFFKRSQLTCRQVSFSNVHCRARVGAVSRHQGSVTRYADYILPTEFNCGFILENILEYQIVTTKFKFNSYSRFIFRLTNQLSCTKADATIDKRRKRKFKVPIPQSIYHTENNCIFFEYVFSIFKDSSVPKGFSTYPIDHNTCFIFEHLLVTERSYWYRKLYGTVDTVPHLVTCKLCLSRIFTHLALTQSNYTDQ